MKCQKCGESFKCDADNKMTKCWCMELPPVALPAEFSSGGCLCPKCLPLFADKQTTFHSQDLAFRVVVVEATSAVRQIAVRQEIDPIATIILGRAIVGAALIAGQAEGGHAVGVVFDGDGPLGQVFAEATYEGDVRGYCSNPTVANATPEQLADIQSGRIGAAIGSGILRVVRNQTSQNESQVGAVPIQTGEVGDDIAFYFHQSFQIKSVLSLGVHLNRNGEVEAAGGVLIELLPGASEMTIRMLERYASAAPPVSRLIHEGQTAREILKFFVGETTLVGGDNPRPLAFKCICSLGRVERSLMLLGIEALDEMITDGETIESRCEFCGNKYNIPLASLTRLRDECVQNKNS